MLNIVLFGPPGAGKGTQSKKLCDAYHLIHLSTGDLLRDEISRVTSLGMQAKSVMDKGELVSDEIVIAMIDAKLNANPQAKGFIFAADLVKMLKFPCEISFVKLASYHGTDSTGTVNEIIGLTENVENRTIVIIEDIVDTGTTLEKLHDLLKHKKAKQIKTATLLFKPMAYKKTIPVDYICMEIPNDFVVGYGLDYNGLGRNLKDIYVLA